MSKNSVLAVFLSLAAICVSVDLKADFSTEVVIRVFVDGKGIVFNRETFVPLKTDADGSITVGSIKRQIISYINRQAPNISCCMRAELSHPRSSKVYENDNYRISDRERRQWAESRIVFNGFIL